MPTTRDCAVVVSSAGLFRVGVLGAGAIQYQCEYERGMHLNMHQYVYTEMDAYSTDTQVD